MTAEIKLCLDEFGDARCGRPKWHARKHQGDIKGEFGAVTWTDLGKARVMKEILKEQEAALKKGRVPRPHPELPMTGERIEHEENLELLRDLE
jgi:hypothetical protein